MGRARRKSKIDDRAFRIDLNQEKGGNGEKVKVEIGPRPGPDT